MEHELYPRSGSWLDLLPDHAPPSSWFVFSCLEYGVLEAWEDAEGDVRFYLPEAVGAYRVVGVPGEDVEPIDLDAGDPAHGDPDALVCREGAGWVTLLPDMRRGRMRPQPQPPHKAPARAPKDPEPAEPEEAAP